MKPMRGSVSEVATLVLGTFLLTAALLFEIGVSVVASAENQPPAPIYRPEPDPRLCPSATCAGWFVSLANLSTTPCANGKERSHCTDIVVDIEGIGLDPAAHSAFRDAMLTNRALLAGTVEPAEPFGASPRLVLRATLGWQGAGTATPNGELYRVRDNAIRCIAAPCFSYDAALVNGIANTTLSSVDLSGVTTDRRALEAATRLMSTGSVLVAGTIFPQPNAGPAGGGRVLVASQFYLPVGSDAVDSP